MHPWGKGRERGGRGAREADPKLNMVKIYGTEIIFFFGWCFGKAVCGVPIVKNCHISRSTDTSMGGAKTIRIKTDVKGPDGECPCFTRHLL